MMSNRATVVVGFVDSPGGWAALEHAIAETRRRDGHLAVVHSMEGGSATSADEIRIYRDLLEQIDERLAGEGISYEVDEYVRGKGL